MFLKIAHLKYYAYTAKAGDNIGILAHGVWILVYLITLSLGIITFCRTSDKTPERW